MTDSGMDDLISRVAALEVIEAVKNVSWSQSGKVLCGKMYSQIKDLPAVDAVPVVRCRDCKHYNTNGCADGFGWCERNGDGHGSTDDWFCADGERRYDDAAD